MKAQSLFDVGGHVAVVTGAASGVGLAITEALGENGARVQMIDMDAPGLLAPYNVLVNAMAPGPFLTNIGGGRLHRDRATVEAFERIVPEP